MAPGNLTETRQLITMRVTHDLLDAINAAADKRGISRTQLMLQAVAAEIDAPDPYDV